MTKQVATIIISYGFPDSLFNAINSVLAEKPGEIIVVYTPKDGDNDVGLLQTRYSSLVKIVTERNKGIAVARNTGLKHVDLPYMAWCDADDVWLKGKLKQQLKLLDDETQWSVCSVEKTGAAEGVFKGWTPSAMLCKTSFVKQVGTWDETYHLAADHDWITRARAVEEPRFLESIQVKKSIHEGNASNRVMEYRKEIMQWIRKQRK